MDPLLPQFITTPPSILHHPTTTTPKPVSKATRTSPRLASPMASISSPILFVLLLLSLSSLLSSISAEVVCEELPQDLCAFAISSSSKRCVLESAPRPDGTTEHQCKTSEVVVERLSDWIETDECVKACGLDRNMVGISSDSLLEGQFVAKLCSAACYGSCPNVVDLYFNLAAGEGVYLPDLCEVKRNPHRSMMVLSSGSAPGPMTSMPSTAEPSAPAPSPSA